MRILPLIKISATIKNDAAPPLSIKLSKTARSIIILKSDKLFRSAFTADIRLILSAKIALSEEADVEYHVSVFVGCGEARAGVTLEEPN